MRDVPASMTTAWKARAKTGSRRPVVRATIQRTQIQTFSYDTWNALGGSANSALDKHTNGVYTSVLFGNPNPVREIKNIQTCSWERSLDQDVATCTIELLNTEVTPIGNLDEETGDYDQPGYYTFSRGSSALGKSRWGHAQNGWRNVFVPDALVKTYEGYGMDDSVEPEYDQHLVQTGVWLIDKVTLNSQGNLSLEMRDIGRLLLDQIAFPPVVPASEYPIGWSRLRNEQVAGRDSKGGHWRSLSGLATAKSSNDLYVGHGYRNGDHAYVDNHGGVRGHYAAMGLKNDKSYFDPYGQLKPKFKTYWLSTGAKSQGQLTWWQADFHDRTTALNAVRIHAFTFGQVYISILGKKGWYGRKKIPYKGPAGHAHNVDIHADIPFVYKVRAEANRPFDVTLPRVYKDVRAVRLTFANQWYQWGGNNEEFPWYAGLHDLMIYTNKNGNSLHFGKGTITKTVGNYADWSDIPIWVSAWCGWFQPEISTGKHFIRTGVGSNKVWYAYPVGALGTQNQTLRLARGHIFGKWDATLTAGVADLTPDQFDKKPMMDMINYVRDLIGFHYFIDEDGGMVWREPNLFRPRNYRMYRVGEGTRESPYQRRRTETSEVVTIDEKETLLNYETVLSSENIRERIFVANVTGNFGTVIAGYNPVPTGIRRVVGWTDQHFASKHETVVMADMVAAKGMFDYRRSRVQTPGYPKIQIDDQVRIFERVTNETYYHYVLGVKSEMDMEAGTWTYDLETHWLGENRSDAWVIDAKELQNETRSFLRLVKQA